MQTTLLGIAITVILALVAALVGPLLIDWGRFRPTIEAEASRLIGSPVRITGPIEAAILPTPSLTLRGIEVGASDESSLIRARSLGIEFNLGSLVRGEWRASEMHLVGPDFNLGLTSTGQLALPKLATGFDPDTLSIERLNIEDGHAVFTDARNDSRLVLDKLWFNGNVRSLAGPFKGDGAFVIASQLYAYRIAAGHVGDDGAIKLRLNIDPLDRPLAVEADGMLSFARGAPRFEGVLNLARPAGIALPNGQTVAHDPWRLTSRLKTTAAAALLEEIEFQYGPDERAVKLTGAAELRFGSKPRFAGVLSARQIDLDRAFATPDTTRLLPFAAIKTLGDSFSGALRPSIPGRIGISVDVLTLAGATVQTLRGDLTADGEAWNLDGFEFRVPGFTQVNLSGRLDVAGEHLGFIGPVSVDSTDPSALVAWLEGSRPSASRIKPLRAQGDVTLGGEKVAIDRLKAQIDRKTVEGRLAYVWAAGDRPARLDADLNAAELDIDALLAFADAARGGTAFETPREVTLGIGIGRALVAGVEARQVSAQLRRDAKGLHVERFSVADFNGTAFDASGQIDTSSSSPRGTMHFHLDARNLAGVVVLAEKFAPNTADTIRRLAERLPAARLDATLTLEDAGPTTVARLAVEGRSGAIRLGLLGEASRNSADLAAGDWQILTAADVRLEGKFEADEGAAIVALLNLEKVIAVDKRPGQLSLVANGPLGGDLQVDGRLLAGGLDASAKGTLRFRGDGPKADLRLSVAAADARPLRPGSAARPGDLLPVTLIGNLAVSGHSLKLDDFSATLAGAGLRGRLAVSFDQPLRIEGQIDADAVDGASVVAAVIGMPAQSSTRADGWAWSSEPFTPGLFEEIDARIEFRAARAAFTPAFVLRQARGVATFTRSRIALTELDGSLADGRVTGQLAFNKNADGLSASGRIRLTNADAAALLTGQLRSPVAGRLSLQVDLEGNGRSPMALVGSLAGNGAASLAQGQFAGLNPKVFEAVTQAVDQGVAPDTAKIGEVVGAALASGRLAVPSTEGVITVAGGQLRLTNTLAPAEGADLTMAGNINLIEGDLNARLALSAPVQASSTAERLVVFISLKGPISGPQRTVDVGALTAWLTLRAVEQQSKRLEAIEREHRLPMAGRPAEDARTSRTAPTGERAPLLPPPIDIRTIPEVSEHKPLRMPAQAQTGSATPPKLGPAKPAATAPPVSRRAPFDLPASPNN